MSVLEDTRNALTDDWSTARQIWQRVGRWSVDTVRQCLITLRRDGTAECQIFYDGMITRNEYRRRPPT